jgi:hypothetical protein
MTVGELRVRLAEVGAPDDAVIRLESDDARFTIQFVHPPGWPGGGGAPSIDFELASEQDDTTNPKEHTP